MLGGFYGVGMPASQGRSNGVILLWHLLDSALE